MAEYPFVRMGDFLRERKEFITIDDMEAYKRAKVQWYGKGTILRDKVPGVEIKTKKQQVIRTNEFVVAEIDAKDGSFGVTPEELDGAIVSSHYFVYEIDQNLCLPSYLEWYVRTNNLQALVKAQGSTNYSAIRSYTVYDYEIPLPSLEEQRRIVRYIESMVPQITEAQRLRKEADVEAEAFYHSALAAAIPWNKNLVSLLETIETGTTITYGVLVPGVNIEDGVPFVRVQDLDLHNPNPKPNKRIAPEISQQYKRTLLQGGEILIGVVGSIGKIGIAPMAWKGANIARAVCRIIPSKNVDTKYLAYVLQSSSSQKYFRDATRTLAQPTLNVRQLEQAPIPVPPLDEQRRIVAYLDGLQAKVNALGELQSASGEELSALMPSVLDRAFNGEL